MELNDLFNDAWNLKQFDLASKLGAEIALRIQNYRSRQLIGDDYGTNCKRN
jgi:hypothetical protein